MTTKEEAQEIANKLTALQEHIDALKSALKTKYGWTIRQMEELDRKIFDQESQNRLAQPSPSQSDQVQRAIDDAPDAVALVHVLYKTLHTMTV